jgi:hypothetical protein
MKEIILTLYTFVLFLTFTPGFLFTFSKKISKTQNTIIHAILFAFVLYFTKNIFWDSISIFESLKSLSNINDNYPMACNETTIGNRNKNNFVCVKKSDRDGYMWDIQCKVSNDIGNVKENKTCQDDYTWK